MRKFILWSCIVCLAAVLIIPLVIIEGSRYLHLFQLPAPTEIHVYVVETGTVTTMGLEDYVRGVVAAEMPAGFHIEALKAQAVAARTYAIGRLRSQGGKGCGKDRSADICTDPSDCQAWISDEQMLEKWGYLDYLSNIRKVNEAVDSTRGVIITYAGRPIDPVYHSCAGGSTENSEDVWTYLVPYLRSVCDDYDQASPYYRTRTVFSVADLERLTGTQVAARTTTTETIDGQELRLVNQGKLSGEDVRILEQSPNGMVKLLALGEVTMTGREVRELLGLPSARFTLDVLSDGVAFTTKGYGHGVGMSQYGANGMGNAGYAFTDILRHYYSGVEIVKVY